MTDAAGREVSEQIISVICATSFGIRPSLWTMIVALSSETRAMQFSKPFATISDSMLDSCSICEAILEMLASALSFDSWRES